MSDKQTPPVCPECNGNGRVQNAHGHDRCFGCDGSGKQTPSPSLAHHERITSKLSAVEQMMADHARELAEWKRRALVAEAEVDRLDRRMGQASCPHVDPMVIDSSTAWCGDCGAFYMLRRWRMPERRAASSPPLTAAMSAELDGAARRAIRDAAAHSPAAAWEAGMKALEAGASPAAVRAALDEPDLTPPSTPEDGGGSPPG